MKIEVNDVWVKEGESLGRFVQWIGSYGYEQDILYWDHVLEKNVLSTKDTFDGMKLISRGFIDIGKTYRNIDERTIGFGNKYEVIGFDTDIPCFAEIIFEGKNRTKQLVSFLSEQCEEIKEEM